LTALSPEKLQENAAAKILRGSRILQNKNKLEEELTSLYHKFNNSEFIKYDPIKYIYEFEDKKERELVGLISSSLSFGRVTQIFKAMDRLLDIFGNEPLRYVLTLGKKPEEKLLSFKYRFVSGFDVFKLLSSAKKIIQAHGSIGEFARKNHNSGKFLELVAKTIEAFQGVHYLIPCSLKNSPCKRLFMFFRWMVRDDNIDPGLWEFIKPQELIIPLDTHIFQMSKEMKLTTRRSASLRTAMEITDNLKRYSKYDPVKYDWALSHIGIIRNNFMGKV